ncbi:MAG: heme-binding protein [Pseudomonadota bacterium]
MTPIWRVGMWIAAAVLGCLVVVAAVWIFVIQDVETPEYTVDRSDGAFELRRYPPLVIAEVRKVGPRLWAIQHGFRPLARYIFASGREGERIAMTAPVTQTPLEDALEIAGEGNGAAAAGAGMHGTWAVRFIMPSEHNLEDLPVPAPGSDIRFHRQPAASRAAIRFPGVATDAVLAEKEGELRRWMRDQGLTPVGPPDYAFYNDPTTPGFLRRNEVIIEVTIGSSG